MALALMQALPGVLSALAGRDPSHWEGIEY